MNKLERKIKGWFKYKKRLKHYRLKGTNHHIFKSTGTPCSCSICSPGKIEEKAKYRDKLNKSHHSIK